MEQGRLDDALAHLQRAAALAPRDETMQFNLGNALAQSPRVAEAAARVSSGPSRSIRIFSDAHVNLGALLMSLGKAPEALAHFRARRRSQARLGRASQQSQQRARPAGRFPEAMQHVRRALELSPATQPALENLRRFQQMGIK